MKISAAFLIFHVAPRIITFRNFLCAHYQVQASHLLVKHRESRRPSSWKQDKIIRSKEEALEILKSAYVPVYIKFVVRVPTTANGESRWVSHADAALCFEIWRVITEVHV